mgnify:CR=1 FL=1
MAFFLCLFFSLLTNNKHNQCDIMIQGFKDIYINNLYGIGFILSQLFFALGLNYLDEEGKNLSTISFADLIYQDETKPGVEFKVIPNDQYYEPQDISSSGEASYYLPAKYNENVTNDLANYYQSIHYETDEDMTLKIVGVLRLSEESPLD